MKFTSEKDSLLQALTSAQRGVPSRPERAILSCLRLSLEGDTLEVLSTDLDIWIHVKVQVADGGEPGTAVIEAKRFIEAVRSCPAGAVEVDSEPGKTKLTAGSAVFDFNTMPVNDFPELPPVEYQKITLDAQELLASLRQVVTSRSLDSSRAQVLTSVLAEPDQPEGGNPVLRLVCTDSYRLALREIENSKLVELDQQILMPGRYLDEMVRYAGAAEELEIGINDEQVRFEVGNATFTMNLIEGEYPKYKNLIPKGDDYPIRLEILEGEGDTTPKESLKQAINQVRVMAGPDSPLRLTMSADQLLLRASSDHGEGTATIAAKLLGGYGGGDDGGDGGSDDAGEADEAPASEESGAGAADSNDGVLTVAFNSKYLLDGIDACPGDGLVIYALDELKPVVLRGTPEENFLYLLMPVRVADN